MDRTVNSAKPASWQTKFLAVLGPILLLAAPISYTYHQNSAKKRLDQSEKATKNENELRQKLIDWPLGPPPQRSFTHVDLPPVPVLPPVRYLQQPDGQSVFDGMSLNERVLALLSTHPTDDVRLKFEPLVSSGEISLNYQANPDNNAEFRIVRRMEISDASFNLPEGQNIFVVLVVNPLWLAEMQSEEDIRLAQLTFLHEYQHYEQYRASDGKDRILWELGPKSKLPPEVTQRESCDRTWRNENDAFAGECRASNAWGIKQSGDFCAFVDTPQWNQVVLHILFQRKSALPHCGRTWAELAGHPYPEGFPEFVEP